MSLPSCLFGAFSSLVCGLALAQNLPSAVTAALARANIPQEAVTFLVVDAESRLSPRLNHRAHIPVNPASTMKLVTTYAALDLLGPAYTWRTPVFVAGTVQDDTLLGNLYIKGQGDPKLVAERLWLLLRRVQGLGIAHIVGDIVLDHSAFTPTDTHPADFDDEPLRPYNATPDAFLFNFKSIVMTFVPDLAAQVARVHVEPPLAGVQMPKSVPLSNEACGNYRASLKADFSDAARVRFAGTYPSSCAEKVWAVAYTDPKSFSTRAVEGLWREMGGKLSGTVRYGIVPPLSTPTFEMTSPALAEVIRDINKFSNNVMAQQVFLTLSLPGAVTWPETPGQALPPTAPIASFEASRLVVQRWWKERIASNEAPTLDNGAGLSREARISAQALGRLLQTAYLSPLMPELMASLPIAGVDGTLRRSRNLPEGRAHLKTGTLRNVSAVAGYVHAASGKRYVLVAIANHANASAVRPAIDALVDWTINDN